MKAVIFAGGLGTRISEETSTKPKPMVEIGGKPLLWHIMKIYAANGINDFVVCLGYKGYVIKEYFCNYYNHMSDLTVNLSKGCVEVHKNHAESWRITLVDTGEATMTGGRLKRVMPYLKNEKAFCLTYGDGVSDIDVKATIAFHKKHGKLATVSAVLPPGRFGALKLKGDAVRSFQEKPEGDGQYINGGFFVLSPKVVDYIDCGDETIWERSPLEKLAANNQLRAFRHDGFWQPVDTLRDKMHLEDLWQSNQAPWKVWKR